MYNLKDIKIFFILSNASKITHTIWFSRIIEGKTSDNYY